MMLTPANNSPVAEAVSGKQHAGIIGNEGGFILALTMFILAICMLLGIAAMNTSVDETDISTNEVIVKRVFTLAESGLPLAAVPVLTTGGKGTWDTGTISNPIPVFLDDTNPLRTAASGTIAIIDGKFLQEDMDADSVYDTSWNNADKYLNAPSANKTAYKPIDDPFQKKKPDGTYYDATIDSRPDILIRSNDLTINIDVDWTSVKPLNSSEFAAGSDGQSWKMGYNMNCKATLPGRDIENSNSPLSELNLGYRLVTGAGI
jgi:hypothetical protein